MATYSGKDHFDPAEFREICINQRKGVLKLISIEGLRGMLETTYHQTLPVGCRIDKDSLIQAIVDYEYRNGL
jgi:hypothetical protein